MAIRQSGMVRERIATDSFAQMGKEPEPGAKGPARISRPSNLPDYGGQKVCEKS